MSHPRVKLFQSDSMLSELERQQIIAASHLAYVNPFLPERIAKEKELLGEGFQGANNPWNLQPGRIRRDPNIAKIVELIEPILAKGPHGALLKSEGKTIQDGIHGAVFFLTFHHFMEQFDRLIDAELERREPLERVGFYGDFQKRLAYYLGEDWESSQQWPSAEQLFAFFYQLRRAFVFIFHFFVGSSEASTRLRARLWQSLFTHDLVRYHRGVFARMSDFPTLITGPSGSGKEVVARAMGFGRYVAFDARTQRFVTNFSQGYHPVNLSALSSNLLESELFGHAKGAFTGAQQARTGFLEACGEFGAVFLDEIGETSEEIQVKLLRVLQTRQFNRLGETQPRHFAGKVVAATNRNLEDEMRAGRFRKDFYFRLCADRIETPSLRQILDSTPHELNHLITYIAQGLVGDDEAPRLTDETVSFIQKNLGKDYAWPGNFRELEQCTRSILIHGSYEALPPEETDTPWEFRDTRQPLEAIAAAYARKVYAQSQSYKEAAATLGIDWRTVKRYVES